MLEKSRGAVIILMKLGDLNKQILLHGSTRKNEALDL